VRYLAYALLLLGFLACLGVLYFQHELRAAEQALRAEQQSRAHRRPAATGKIRNT
jgi:hypothetical protein